MPPKVQYAVTAADANANPAATAAAGRSPSSVTLPLCGATIQCIPCGLGRRPSRSVELGYWIARPFWGRGLATEACEALVDIARTLGFQSLEGSHFLDNPASGRVLEKLGFEPLGIVAPRLSCARGEEVPARLMRLELASAGYSDNARESEALAA